MNAEQLRAELERIANHCEDAGLIVAPGELRNLAALLSGMAAGWQPIETAPKDGAMLQLLVQTQFSVCDHAASVKHNSIPMTGNWDEHTERWITWNHDGCGGLVDAVSHWMPLPAAPEPTNA